MEDINESTKFSVCIRRFEPKDIDLVKSVAKVAFSSEVDRYWSVVGALRTQYTYVAEVENRVVGVIEFELVHLSKSAEGHIGYIFVHPKYQRQGIGTALLREAERILFKSGAKRIWAVTSPDNISARKFFERNKYREISIEMMKKLLGSNNTKKLLRRMVYFRGDIVYFKELNFEE